MLKTSISCSVILTPNSDRGVIKINSLAASTDNDFPKVKWLHSKDDWKDLP